MVKKLKEKKMVHYYYTAEDYPIIVFQERNATRSQCCRGTIELHQYPVGDAGKQIFRIMLYKKIRLAVKYNANLSLRYKKNKKAF